MLCYILYFKGIFVDVLNCVECLEIISYLWVLKWESLNVIVFWKFKIKEEEVEISVEVLRKFVFLIFRSNW